jgi:ferredoxin
MSAGLLTYRRSRIGAHEGAGREVANLEIRIHRDLCMASGQCAFHAPNTFDIDDEMKVTVLAPGDADGIDDDHAIRAAIASCPTRALELVGHEPAEGTDTDAAQ